MITKYGKLIIKEDAIEITNFTYNGAGEKFDEKHPLMSALEREAIQWAISRLQESLWIKCSERMTRKDCVDQMKMIRNGAYGRIPENFQIIWAEAKNAIANAETYYMFVRRRLTK